MSNFLAIDTSSRHLTVLAVKDVKISLRHSPDCAMRHSVTLMDEIDAAMKEANLTCAECGFFAAVTGPGSFTGIRIGISTVKGLALGAGKKLLGLTAFDVIAYNVKNENFAVCIDAAHDHYYARGYGKNAFAPAYLSREEVEALGTSIYGFEELPLTGYTKLDVKDCLYPAILAVKDGVTEDISALYVRKSQAEEGRK